MKLTVGQAALNAHMSDKTSVNPREITLAQGPEVLANLEWCVKHALKEVDCTGMKGHENCHNDSKLDGDFFVTIYTKREHNLNNVIRNYYFATKACPTPRFEQHLFKYYHQSGNLRYIWSVPDEENALMYKENKDRIEPEERQLLQFVLDFYDGTLLRLSKEFNGEAMHAGGALIHE